MIVSLEGLFVFGQDSQDIMDLFCSLNLPLLHSHTLGNLQLIPSLEEG